MVCPFLVIRCVFCIDSKDKPAVRVNTEATGTVPADTEHIPLTVEDSVVQAVHPLNM